MRLRMDSEAQRVSSRVDNSLCPTTRSARGPSSIPWDGRVMDAMGYDSEPAGSNRRSSFNIGRDSGIVKDLEHLISHPAVRKSYNRSTRIVPHAGVRPPAQFRVGSWTSRRMEPGAGSADDTAQTVKCGA